MPISPLPHDASALMKALHGRRIGARGGAGTPYEDLDWGMFQALLDDDLRALESLKAGGGGKEYATVVVAASNTHASAKAVADYVCTGTNDHDTVQQALDAVSALGGGKVLLLEGTYNFDYNQSRAASVRVGSNTWLCGSGPGTVITFPRRTETNLRVVYAPNGVSNVTISDLQFVALSTSPNGFTIIEIAGTQVIVDRCFFTGESGPCVLVPSAAAQAVVSNCIGTGRNALVSSAGDVSVVNCIYSKNGTGSFSLLSVASGLVANCLLLDTGNSGLSVTNSSSPLVIANTVVKRTLSGTAGSAFNMLRSDGGPFLAVNCVFGSVGCNTSGLISSITGPTQFVNCYFRSASTGANFRVFGPVTSPGYVAFLGCVFDRRGATGANSNLLLGNGANALNLVQVVDCTFLADTGTTYNLDISTPQTQNTIVIGNLFRGTIGTGHINNAGTNTQLVLPTGALGNNFAL